MAANAVIVDSGSDIDYMKQSLDDVAAHFIGSGHVFDQKYYDKLTSCLNKFNDTLL